jgi:hypothetical protein
LTARPFPAVSGCQPFSDLLFSPRAAFIWNHTRKTVAWMNPAARAAFGLCLEDFARSLPAALVRRFEQCLDKQRGASIKVKAGGAAVQCAVEILKLAGGQDGVIVAEICEGGAPQLSHGSGKKGKGPEKPARKPPVPVREERALPPARAPALTDEEMRAFKAIGRKVRRLCKEKSRAEADAKAAVPLSPPAPAASIDAAPAPGRAAAALPDLFAAFDLVIFLGKELDIVRVSGRPLRLGWRKKALSEKRAPDLLAPPEQTILRRMLKKLNDAPARIAKDTILILSEAGNGTPCRAVIGRSQEGGAAYFLALLSLDLPARLRKQHALISMTTARLAA